MKIFLIAIAFVSYINAGTYDEHYSVFDNNSSSKNYDLLMHGEFEEIIRYKEISYEDGDFSDDSGRIEDIANKILSYDENRTLVSIIGHTNIKNHKKNTAKQLDISKKYVEDIVSRLEDFNISKESMILEYRGGNDNLYIQYSKNGKELSNQVMISIYVKIKEKDSDNDGVVDSKDECPTTPEGLSVNEKGCHIPEKDSDEDGILDSNDICPKTIRGLSVNEQGCHIFKTLRLNYIVNSSVIKEESMDKVIEFTEFLNTNEMYKVNIIGHTDSVGSAESNQILSEQRANSVKDYLIANDIDISRVSTRGAGENEPLVSNDTDFNKAKNRRIEVEIDFIAEEGL